MTQATREKHSPLKIVAIVVAFFVVILFTCAAGQIRDYSQGYTITYDTRDYLYPAENGRFGSLYETALQDMDKKTSYSTEVAECRALAFYYEQAVLEHAYRKTGNTEKANEFTARMKEYEAQLGSMSSKAEAVRKAVETS